MQVPLNADGDYVGGRLIYASAGGGLQQPPRPAGSATIHDSSIPHGVTRLVSGVRYGLFFLLLARDRRGSRAACGGTRVAGTAAGAWQGRPRARLAGAPR